MTKQDLNKIAEYVQLSMNENAHLVEKVAELEQEAADRLVSKEKLAISVKSAAEALYSSDFINDSYEKRQFVKRAMEDPSYLAKAVEKLCKAADVVNFGKVSKVKSAADDNDPVMRRAFGYDNNYTLLDDE